MPPSQAEDHTRAIAQRFIQSLGERNMEQLIPLFDEQVDWFVPGNQTLAPWTGKRETKQEINAVFELLWENTEPVSADIDCILAEGKSAVVTGTFSSRMLPTGKVVESLFSIHITVKNGLIVKYRLLEDSYAVSVALTS